MEKDHRLDALARTLANSACTQIAGVIGEPLDGDQVGYLVDGFKKLLNKLQGNN
jgi:hypothetical protein